MTKDRIKQILAEEYDVLPAHVNAKYGREVVLAGPTVDSPLGQASLRAIERILEEAGHGQV